jgi:hypothetical protein
MAIMIAQIRPPGATNVSGNSKYADAFECKRAVTTMRNAAKVGKVKVITAQKGPVR